MCSNRKPQTSNPNHLAQLFWSAIMSHMANRKEPSAGVGVSVGAGGAEVARHVALKEPLLLHTRSRSVAAAAQPAGPPAAEGAYAALTHR